MPAEVGLEPKDIFLLKFSRNWIERGDACGLHLAAPVHEEDLAVEDVVHDLLLHHRLAVVHHDHLLEVFL